ncbi:MAG: MBOAT family O-acyltransferase [Candidatus Stygibacter frigidus]|nr:MBOAT family O-acyltransferase [Candidatus Stygibacter frigidus]
MLFNSISFLLFFPTVCLLYFIVPHKYRWLLLLIASYYFYMSWKASYAILLLSITIINYSAGLMMAKYTQKRQRKFITIMTVVLSLSTLYYFKYFNFFGETINFFLQKFGIGLNIPLNQIILPVGISFFTFQALSYTIDVYRGDMKVERNFGIFALFVSFFPQLVAGPIERATNLLKQFYEKHNFSEDQLSQGLRLMLWGMFKKVVIADRAAIYVNEVYNNHTQYGGIAYIIATILFAIQIYCDFSGYSDLARGSARIMGFRLMVNFRFPYFSRNVSAYWQKNHISLTTWLKDYIYYPLVEIKPTIYRMCLITMFTFLLSGLWHGADWTFVIWGGWQAVFLIYDILIRRFRKKLDKWLKKRRLFNLSLYFRYLITFVILALGLVFFRASSITQAQEVLTGIITLKTGEIYLNYSALLYSLAGIIILISAEYNDHLDFDEFVQLRFKNRIIRWGYYYFILMIILALGSKESAEFIYFQF